MIGLRFLSIEALAAISLCLGSVSMHAASVGSDRQAPLYRLGPGDRLAVKLFQVQGFDAAVAVLPDGTVNLPRVGALRVWGLTVDQARSAITRAYGKVLRDPIVYLDLTSTRPLRVTVSGEVQRPGLYSLGLTQAGQLANSDGGEAQVIASQGWPTLVEAIQTAGGLTSRGDLRRVTLMRPDGAMGTIRTTTIDYWSALRSGTPVDNPLIYDGDSIRIPEAKAADSQELITVASSSFAPSSITVTVVGEVEKPGEQQVRANSPLSQAVLTAGGPTRRASRSSLELLRVMPDGSILRRQLSYAPDAALGTTNNPHLQDGDVVVVDRHGWAKFNDGLKSTVEPMEPLLSGLSVFRLLGKPIN